MEKKFELLPPTMPNFVQFKREAALKHDGFKTDEGFPISQFTRQEAEEFAELMKTEFIRHWEVRCGINKLSGFRGETNSL